MRRFLFKGKQNVRPRLKEYIDFFPETLPWLTLVLSMQSMQSGDDAHLEKEMDMRSFVVGVVVLGAVGCGSADNNSRLRTPIEEELQDNVYDLGLFDNYFSDIKYDLKITKALHGRQRDQLEIITRQSEMSQLRIAKPTLGQSVEFPLRLTLEQTISPKLFQDLSVKAVLKSVVTGNLCSRMGYGVSHCIPFSIEKALESVERLLPEGQSLKQVFEIDIVESLYQDVCDYLNKAENVSTIIKQRKAMDQEGYDIQLSGVSHHIMGGLDGFKIQQSPKEWVSLSKLTGAFGLHPLMQHSNLANAKTFYFDYDVELFSYASSSCVVTSKTKSGKSTDNL